MKFREIEQLNGTGLVKAVYTTIENYRWKFGNDGTSSNITGLAADLGINVSDMVMVSQKHTDRIKAVDHGNGGEMITFAPDDNIYDGMITDEKNLLLCTLEADCVPVYILDPVRKAIGMVHSGWRGTASNIAVNAVRLMQNKYNSSPEDIMIVIGPHACASCYEVGSELLNDFSRNYDSSEISRFFINRKGDKYHLDMTEAIIISLERIGVKAENIYDTGLCTIESDFLCSWRRDNPVMRSMLTWIMLI